MADKTTCEKRLPSGNYCRKKQEFKIQPPGAMSSIKVCANHLSSAVEFLCGYGNPEKVVSVIKLTAIK